MTPIHSQPIDVFDTAEIELPPTTGEMPTAEVEPGRPSWEPDDGDFN